MILSRLSLGSNISDINDENFDENKVETQVINSGKDRIFIEKSNKLIDSTLYYDDFESYTSGIQLTVQNSIE